jgi:NTP pyrophosphatase (non-canonical NTP hydrolase)
VNHIDPSTKASDAIRGRATQERVRITLMQLGGYWRPLAGLARLLEELGELAESAGGGAADRHELASELADLWVISTVLADQFLGDVLEPDAYGLQASGSSLADLVATAGPIARIVNYYDGPKTPSSLQGWPSLNAAVKDFHRVLAGLAAAYDVELGRAVSEKLDAIRQRDAGRFEHDLNDPSTAASLVRFRSLRGSMSDPADRAARLWGAPAWREGRFAVNVEALVPALRSFARASRRERLDGYLIEGPPSASVDHLRRWHTRLARELSRHDSQRRIHGAAAQSRSSSQFSFEGLPLAATLFSPAYGSADVGHIDRGTFLLLRSCATLEETRPETVKARDVAALTSLGARSAGGL